MPPPRIRLPRGVRAAAVICAAVLLAVAGVVYTVTQTSLFTPDPAPSWTVRASTPTTPPAPSPTPKPPPHITPLVNGWSAWAYANRETGQTAGSVNADGRNDTTPAASVIKTWLAADWLRLHASEPGQPGQRRLEQIRRMIRYSDNMAASTFYAALGGARTIERMARLCDLLHAKPSRRGWGMTALTAADTTRLGLCIADGRAAGRWTKWLMTEMRQITGDGVFGIPVVFPSDVVDQIAYKNGWLLVDGMWHVNCLAIGDTWVLSVLTRYPAALQIVEGATACEIAGDQLARYLAD